MSEQRIEAKLPDYGTRTDEITIYAGPCSVESEEQFFEVAECISDLGLTWIRGGAYKPRTNPHSFQGLGEEALKIMKAGGEKYGLKTLTEVMDSEHCELVHSYVDGLQVGARNFQNFSLLKNIGKVTKDSHKMVLFKRGARHLGRARHPQAKPAAHLRGRVPPGRRARPGSQPGARCSGRGRRLHHDRGAPQPAGGAFRRPAAADSGAVPRPGRGAARDRRGVREEDRLAVAKRFA